MPDISTRSEPLYVHDKEHDRHVDKFFLSFHTSADSVTVRFKFTVMGMSVMSRRHHKEWRHCDIIMPPEMTSDDIHRLLRERVGNDQGIGLVFNLTRAVSRDLVEITYQD